MKGFRVEISYPTSKSGFWRRIRYGLAKMLLGKGYFHGSRCWTREDLDELRKQNQEHDFAKGMDVEDGTLEK